MIKHINKLFIVIILINKVVPQLIIPADPYNILYFEYKAISDSTHYDDFLIRPIIKYRNNNKWSFMTRSELYFNTGFPNFENMGNRYIGGGASLFSSFNFSYIGKYIILSVEPYYMNSQNKEVMISGRDGMFGRLNDVGYNTPSPYKTTGLRETQLYFHYKSLGIGYSNANMWWGPGLHNTLTMTNNATGFNHLMIGTLQEKRIRNIGYNFRYVFSTLDKTIGNPYFTGLVWSLRFYTNPLISIGLSRNYLSGGLPTDRPFTKMDAALIVFEQLLIDTKIKEYPSEWEAHDPWDELMSGFLILDFPLSNLRIYAEFGTNDHRQNLSDLRTHPDHASAYIVGLRKYEIFNNKFLFGGFEYANLIFGKFWQYRATPNWYDKNSYDYSSYEGRRWAAHSGSDSDDFHLYLGYQKKDWFFISSFNYVRHGVIFSRFPEVKMEIRLDVRYMWNDYKFNIYLEREWLEHAGFVSNKWRNGNVVWFGIERDITSLLSNKLGFLES